MEDPIHAVCLALSVLVLPVSYLLLCLRMRHAGIPKPPYLPWFFVFGSYGGWLLAMGLFPSSFAVGSLLFLLTIAPLALLASVLSLWPSRALSRYHRAAYYGSLSYFGFIVLLLCACALFSNGPR